MQDAQKGPSPRDQLIALMLLPRSERRRLSRKAKMRMLPGLNRPYVK